MNIEEALTLVEQRLISRPLNPIEGLVFRQSWIGQTYNEIAQDSAYGIDYLKEVGSQLWNDLSEALGERVTKKNVHLVFSQYEQTQTGTSKSANLNAESDRPLASPIALEFPGRPLFLDSPFYINRPPIEELAIAEIHKPGCVLRIKAPKKMGKSSLVNRILAHATEKKYKTVFLDFQEADATILSNLDKFLRWFCANTSRQLQLPSQLDDYWDEDIGSKVSCKLYFEGYLLPAIATSLVLTLNEVNRIFEYPKIAGDFLPMLRTWHEQASQIETWQKLRLVVVHSTEIYVPLKLNQSPFNVGLALKLPEFTTEQVQALARRYEFDRLEGEAGMQRLDSLVEMVGGHPYLINLAFYYLCQGEMTLEKLLQEAAKPTGIYSEHLRSLFVALQEEPQLAAALNCAIAAEQSEPLEAIAAYKLESLGLIRLDGDRAKPSCQLYRLFFSDRLVGPRWIDERLEKLEQEKQELQRLSNLDELTQLANRRYFNQYLQAEWQQLAGEIPPLSLILCDVDYFKVYNDAHGRLAGDECLRRIANTIRECVKHRANIVARYGGEEFAVILPQTDAETAVQIAETIRASVKNLAIAYDNPKIDGLPSKVITLSLGVSSAKPSAENTPDALISAADKALFQSKKQGRDRVTLPALNDKNKP